LDWTFCYNLVLPHRCTLLYIMECSSWILGLDLLAVTGLYIGFLFAVNYVECDVENSSQEPCTTAQNMRDNTATETFITEFFVAGSLLLFGLHLAWWNHNNHNNNTCSSKMKINRNSKHEEDVETDDDDDQTHGKNDDTLAPPTIVQSSAILGQLLMAGAYILFGLAHWFVLDQNQNEEVTNTNGVDRGTVFWILSGLGYGFLTSSTMNIARFVESSANDHNQAWCLTVWAHLSTRLLRFFVGVTIVFSIGLLVGHFWCAIAPSDSDGGGNGGGVFVDHHKNETSAASLSLPSSTGAEECLRLIEVSEIGYQLSYVLFWIPAAVLLRGAAIQAPETINGLPTSAAALLLLFVQVTIGFAYRDIWIPLMATILDRRATELYHQMYGSIVTQYGVLVSFYLLHNLSLSLNQERSTTQSKQPAMRHTLKASTAIKGAWEAENHSKNRILDVKTANEEPPRDNVYFF
jgi:hypothetical protein